MKVLIVYQEGCKQHRAVVDMSAEEYEMFSNVHNMFIPASLKDKDYVMLDVVQAAFREDDYWLKHTKGCLAKHYLGKWKSNPYNQDISNVDGFISCGVI